MNSAKSQFFPKATSFDTALVRSKIMGPNPLKLWDPHYLDERLLPYVKQGGMLYLSIPGMVRDCHDNLPACLLKSWTPEQLDYMHDIDWWRAIISQTEGVEIVDMHAMECTTEAWADWLACDNPYAQGDRAAIAAGALGYLNTIAITLRKL